jgi:hypothetical protein
MIGSAMSSLLALTLSSFGGLGESRDVRHNAIVAASREHVGEKHFSGHKGSDRKSLLCR